MSLNDLLRNILEKQLNEYLVKRGEKDGKKGIFYGGEFVSDEDRFKEAEANPKPKLEPQLEPKREPKPIPEPKEKDFVPRYPTLQPNINPKPIPEPKEKDFVPVPVPGRSFPGEKRPTLPGEKPSELSNLFMDIKPKNVDSEPSEKFKKIQRPKDELIGKKKKPAFEPENRPYIT